ncbi:hypothetical protein QFZ23_002487 [Arthrobacter globiformis]|uniref:hypothetical protein n=1 Tax=Arthrobacter globiformis TaxID=1665 RepID=UPI002785A94D|nr:hypothetical protein [Arthrobacter globiformis]MDQ1058586.1 hypothetical protein [Arthrobacter globiformis]
MRTEKEGSDRLHSWPAAVDRLFRNVRHCRDQCDQGLAHHRPDHRDDPHSGNGRGKRKLSRLFYLAAVIAVAGVYFLAAFWATGMLDGLSLLNRRHPPLVTLVWMLLLTWELCSHRVAWLSGHHGTAPQTVEEAQPAGLAGPELRRAEFRRAPSQLLG